MAQHAASVRPATEFLPQIHALRALAVSLVVVYHFWPTVLPGGYVGVDVFFVISGYLVTAHLLREHEFHGRLSLSAFYARRARRLLPIALLVLAVTALLTFVVLPPTRWAIAFTDILASALYVENWVLLGRSVDYLAANAEASPVQHYWSLSVEEQFYLFWPLLIIVSVFVARKLARSSHKLIVVALAAVVVASFAYSIFVTFRDPEAAYFSTFARAWEFGAGGLVAALGWRLAERSWIAAIASWAGITAIVISALILNDDSAFPGWVATIPTLGALLVIAAGMPSQAWAPSRLYALRPIGFLGDISYSLYLWHWPLIVFAPFFFGFTHFDALTGALSIAALLLVSALSRSLVEEPVRRLPWLTRARPRRTLTLAGAAMVLVVIMASTGSLAFQARLDQARDAAVAASAADLPVVNDGPLIPDPLLAEEDWTWDRDCWTPRMDAEVVTCEYGDRRSDVRVALVGDSHAAVLMDPIAELGETRGWSVDTYVKQACSWAADGPMLWPGAEFREACTAWREEVQQRLLDASYDIVITTSSQYRVTDESAAGGLVDAWRPVVAQGTELYVLLDNPRWDESPNECLSVRADVSACDQPRDEGLPWTDPQEIAARAVDGVRVIDFSDFYCDAKVCWPARNGYTIYQDEEHLTSTFARSLIDSFDAAIADPE